MNLLVSSELDTAQMSEYIQNRTTLRSRFGQIWTRFLLTMIRDMIAPGYKYTSLGDLKKTDNYTVNLFGLILD